MAVGMIGRFWPLVDGRPQVPVMHGAVRRDEDGYWVVDVEGWDAIHLNRAPQIRVRRSTSVEATPKQEEGQSPETSYENCNSA